MCSFLVGMVGEGVYLQPRNEDDLHVGGKVYTGSGRFYKFKKNVVYVIVFLSDHPFYQL